MAVWDNIRKTINYARRNGPVSAYYAAMERLSDDRSESYFVSSPEAEELEEQKRLSLEWVKKRASVPVSVVVPVYMTNENYLRRMISSLIMQSYTNWELILADSSEGDEQAAVINEYAAKDSRIRLLKLEENEGISGNTNKAIEAARGAYIAFLDHDDFLEPDALFLMAQAVHDRMSETGGAARCPVKLVYSDEDKCDTEGLRFFEHHEKPGFNPDYLLTNNYICHFVMARADLVKKTKLRPEYDGAQDFDLLLRLIGDDMFRPGEDKNIVHIPKVLYHWRSHPQSTALNPASKRYAYDAGLHAVQDFLDTHGISARVTELKHVGFYRVEYGTDIFSTRSDIGVVGGRLNNRLGELVGGNYTDEGKIVFDHLKKGYSGGLQHRAALQQDVDAVDLRCIKIRGSLRELLRETTGFLYREHGGIPTESLPEYEVRNRSIRFCKKVREMGYRVLWDPEWTTEVTR